mmetsp:Transcript_51466/g.88573  ORF Transcript_51466/g.88573 Transcript_51466/m.88573 type:complete len:204 (+) Transcript_51466:251-862(+)
MMKHHSQIQTSIFFFGEKKTTPHLGPTATPSPRPPAPLPERPARGPWKSTGGTDALLAAAALPRLPPPPPRRRQRRRNRLGGVAAHHLAPESPCKKRRPLRPLAPDGPGCLSGCSAEYPPETSPGAAAGRTLAGSPAGFAPTRRKRRPVRPGGRGDGGAAGGRRHWRRCYEVLEPIGNFLRSHFGSDHSLCQAHPHLDSQDLR